MDRNRAAVGFRITRGGVALRKESVDRNTTMQIVVIVVDTSLSARRAWIEILVFAWQVCLTCVALRKESVDRNPELYKALSHVRWSLSARRAWIEIACQRKIGCLLVVALRKESVDRNCSGAKADSVSKCRSPQGERG